MHEYFTQNLTNNYFHSDANVELFPEEKLSVLVSVADFIQQTENDIQIFIPFKR